VKVGWEMGENQKVQIQIESWDLKGYKIPVTKRGLGSSPGLAGKKGPIWDGFKRPLVPVFPLFGSLVIWILKFHWGVFCGPHVGVQIVCRIFWVPLSESVPNLGLSGFPKVWRIFPLGQRACLY